MVDFAIEWGIEAVLNKPGVEEYAIGLTFRAFPSQDSGWEAECDELKVPSCGDTPHEAIANVIDATLLYLNTIEELGVRRNVFDEHNIDISLHLETRHTVEVEPDEVVQFKIIEGHKAPVPA